MTNEQRSVADPMKTNLRIMPCLDMRDGRVVKGVHFVDIQDAGDPVACAQAYCGAGADELAMLDITATVENRATLIEVVRRVAAVVTVPFTVGGASRMWPRRARFLGGSAPSVHQQCRFPQSAGHPGHDPRVGGGQGRRRH